MPTKSTLQGKTISHSVVLFFPTNVLKLCNCFKAITKRPLCFYKMCNSLYKNGAISSLLLGHYGLFPTPKYVINMSDLIARQNELHAVFSSIWPDVIYDSLLTFFIHDLRIRNKTKTYEIVYQGHTNPKCGQCL